MTTDEKPCTYCPHDAGPHQIYIVDVGVLGFMVCPVPGCTCGATVRGSTTGPSSPEEIAETRDEVRRILINAGMPLPAFLR